MDRFDLKTKIFFGDNALDRLRDNPYDRILVIADPFVVESGMINSLTRRLDEAHKEYHVYSDVIPDPPLVVGIAMSFISPFFPIFSENSFIDFALSIAAPPPTATIASGL